MAVYACSDLHGHLELYKKIKEFLKPEDKVYFLGDAGDRGPQPWETIKAIKKDEQFIYLKGNHEDMLVKAAREYCDSDDYSCYYQHLLTSNGGGDTLDGLLMELNAGLWISELAKLPTYKIYKNTNKKKIFLCHAGMTWRGKIPTDKELIWNRDHFYDGWDDEEKYIVVHGHTPIPYLARELDGIIDDNIVNQAYSYADGNKYCVDAWTIATKKAILLNLDTFESVLFKLKD